MSVIIIIITMIMMITIMMVVVELRKENGDNFDDDNDELCPLVLCLSVLRSSPSPSFVSCFSASRRASAPCCAAPGRPPT
jgi:hypothetical protein